MTGRETEVWHPRVYDAMFGQKVIGIDAGAQHRIDIMPQWPFSWQRVDWTELSHWGGPGDAGVFVRASVAVSMVFDKDLHISEGRYVAAMTRLSPHDLMCSPGMALVLVILNKTAERVTLRNLKFIGFEYR